VRLGYWWKAFLRALTAFVGSLVLSVIAFVLLNVIPIWTLMLIFGSENVEGSPGGGAGILFLTVPFGGLVALGLLTFLTIHFYERLSN
jgi:hypothetical protein